MTIINVLVEHRRAIVISDTLHVHGGQPARLAAKVAAFPPIPALLATAGSGRLAIAAAQSLEGRECYIGGIVDALEALPAALNRAGEAEWRRTGRLERPAEVWLVGLEDGMPAGWRFTEVHHFAPERLAIGTIYATPAHDLSFVRSIDHPERDLINIGKYQAARHPAICGGELILAELRADGGIMVRVVGRLPGFGELEAAVSATYPDQEAA